MSLKDIVQGAREEAAANSVLGSRANKGEEAAQTDAGTAQGSSQGFTRRSAARGKPAREAAAGVRVVSSSGKSKKKAGLSKEEQKAEKARERELEDQRYSVREMILKDDEEFKRVNKVWHRLLIVGGVVIFISLTLYGLTKQDGGEASPIMAGAALGTMLLAYVIMGIALIYNWQKLRPLRMKTDHLVASMSDKKVKAAVERGGKQKK